MKSKYWQVYNALKGAGYTLKKIDQGYKGNRYRMSRYHVYNSITKETLYNQIVLSVLIDRMQIDGLLPYKDNNNSSDND